MGPMETSAVSGKWCYSFVITNNYSRYAWTAHLTSKDQTAAKFKAWISMIENNLGRRIGYFCSDHSGEFMSAEFSAILEKHRITCETSAPYTSQQNGLAECMNQTLIGGARAMLQHSGLSKGFWAEALDVATHVFNRAPRKGLGWCTPYELLFGRVPDVSHLRIFGCSAWVHQNKGKKWDPNSKPMIFIGYEQGSKAYRIWNPQTHSIIVSATVRFDELLIPNKPTAPAPPPPFVPLPAPSVPEHTYVDIRDLFGDSFERHSLPPSPSSSSESDNTQPPPKSDKRRSKCKTKPVIKYEARSSSLLSADPEGEGFLSKIDSAYQTHVEAYINLITTGEPESYNEAINSDDKEKWKEAMDKEVNSLRDMGTFSLAD